MVIGFGNWDVYCNFCKNFSRWFQRIQGVGQVIEEIILINIFGF